MTSYQITITLVSDTTFGRGDGIAGLIDQEVEHDAYGFPYLRGRTLKGLLSEECDNLVAMLPHDTARWNDALKRLFGVAGSTTATAATWHVGDARLPADLRRAVMAQLRQISSNLTPQDILASLTSVRRQTAIDAKNGTPADGSLRAARVVVRELVFTSPVESLDDRSDDRLLLAAGCLALRHLGASRNRGRGEVCCALCDATGADITQQSFEQFGQQIKGAR